MGQGLAFPHPRNPIISDEEEESLSLVYLKHPLDWNAADKAPVNTAVFIVSQSVQNHLKSLSYFARLSREAAFLELLGKKAGKDEILAWLAQKVK